MGIRERYLSHSKYKKSFAVDQVMDTNELEEVLKVLRRNDKLHEQNSGRINALRAEITKLECDVIEYANNGSKSSCIYCKKRLFWFISKLFACPRCDRQCCVKCAVKSDVDLWVCVLCEKKTELKKISGDWLRSSFRMDKRSLRSVVKKTLKKYDIMDVEDKIAAQNVVIQSSTGHFDNLPDCVISTNNKNENPINVIPTENKIENPDLFANVHKKNLVRSHQDDSFDEIARNNSPQDETSASFSEVYSCNVKHLNAGLPDLISHEANSLPRQSSLICEYAFQNDSLTRNSLFRCESLFQDESNSLTKNCSSKCEKTFQDESNPLIEGSSLKYENTLLNEKKLNIDDKHGVKNNERLFKHIGEKDADELSSNKASIQDNKQPLKPKLDFQKIKEKLKQIEKRRAMQSNNSDSRSFSIDISKTDSVASTRKIFERSLSRLSCHKLRALSTPEISKHETTDEIGQNKEVVINKWLESCVPTSMSMECIDPQQNEINSDYSEHTGNDNDINVNIDEKPGDDLQSSLDSASTCIDGSNQCNDKAEFETENVKTCFNEDDKEKQTNIDDDNKGEQTNSKDYDNEEQANIKEDDKEEQTHIKENDKEEQTPIYDDDIEEQTNIKDCDKDEQENINEDDKQEHTNIKEDDKEEQTNFNDNDKEEHTSIKDCDKDEQENIDEDDKEEQTNIKEDNEEEQANIKDDLSMHSEICDQNSNHESDLENRTFEEAAILNNTQKADSSSLENLSSLNKDEHFDEINIIVEEDAIEKECVINYTIEDENPEFSNIEVISASEKVDGSGNDSSFHHASTSRQMENSYSDEDDNPVFSFLRENHLMKPKDRKKKLLNARNRLFANKEEKKTIETKEPSFFERLNLRQSFSKLFDSKNKNEPLIIPTGYKEVNIDTAIEVDEISRLI